MHPAAADDAGVEEAAPRNAVRVHAADAHDAWVSHASLSEHSPGAPC